jgi:hypothetical protein
MKKTLLPNYDQAYKGYIIRTGLIGDFFVGKDGHWISCHRSMEGAKQTINELTQSTTGRQTP